MGETRLTRLTWLRDREGKRDMGLKAPTVLGAQGPGHNEDATRGARSSSRQRSTCAVVGRAVNPVANTDDTDDDEQQGSL